MIDMKRRIMTTGDVVGPIVVVTVVVREGLWSLFLCILPSFVAIDWQKLMFYFATVISNTIYSFFHLTGLLLSLEKKDLRILVGLLTGHANLNWHLKIMGVRNEAVCLLCQDEEETSVHFIAHSSAIMLLWRSILSDYTLSLDTLNLTVSTGPVWCQLWKIFQFQFQFRFSLVFFVSVSFQFLQIFPFQFQFLVFFSFSFRFRFS